jgi:hypothetical protein
MLAPLPGANRWSRRMEGHLWDRQKQAEAGRSSEGKPIPGDVAADSRED